MMYDYGIIGGGPAGYTVAVNLAKKGKKVVLFEKEYLGGTCLNRGCIPTKSLLHSSEIYAQILKSQNSGFDVEIKGVDFNKIMERKNIIVEKIRKGLELAVKNSGVTVVYSEAVVEDKNTIVANSEKYEVGEIIIATGSKSKDLKGLERDGQFILNSDDVLNLSSLPKSVVVVGSGAIGIEWSRIFSNFGVEVILIEKAEHLIPLADIEVSKRIERIFKQNKIKFYTNNSIKSVINKKVVLESDEEFEPDFILSAVGREPVNKLENIFKIIGDACGEIQLAHYAIQQAHKVSKEKSAKLDKNLIPSVIYGEPEIAWVGLREQDCDENCKKITLPISALGKSWCDDSTDGFIKLIVKDDYIVGAHIVSKEASALIHQVLIAMQHNIKVEQLKEVCFAHPTYSEGIFDAICRL